MTGKPPAIARFLSARRIAVAGVSRDKGQAANFIFRKLAASGHDVIPVNPKITIAEGVACYPDLESVPGNIDGVVIATHPAVSADIVRQCVGKGAKQVWFHRSFGEGSVSDDAVRACEAEGIEAIVGGCPLMFCEPVDLAHKCMRWWLQRRGTVPR